MTAYDLYIKLFKICFLQQLSKSSTMQVYALTDQKCRFLEAMVFYVKMKGFNEKLSLGQLEKLKCELMSVTYR